MSYRSLFNVILKIFGLFFVKDFLEITPQLLSSLLYLTKSEMIMEGVWILLLTIATLVVYWFAFYYFVFKTDMIIDQLKLDQGFAEQTVPLNIHRSTVLSIAIIALGGFLVVNEIPSLCKQVFLYFQEKRMTFGFTSPSIAQFVIPFIKIIIGIVLMVSQRQIVNFIEVRRKK